MGKKQKQVPRILSPENYIRQRARNLPLFQCLVNEGWEEEGLVYATIARKHINGNITFCAYLVDLKCLGIKDTMYFFNAHPLDFNEFKDDMSNDIDSIECDYDLVHNVIHAAWEYAEEIGFEPHRDFLSITQYMLEEDTDEIPLMDIHCGGDDGKPLYVQGPLEDDVMANMIVNRLEKKLGPGNFHYVLKSEVLEDYDFLSDDEELFDDDDDEYDEFFDDGDDEWDEFDDDYIDEYYENSLEENIDYFLELTQFMEGDDEWDDEEDEEWDDEEDPWDIDLDEEDEEEEALEKLKELEKIDVITDLLYEEFIDFTKLKRVLAEWEEEAASYTVTNAVFYQMLGLESDEEVSYEDLTFMTRESVGDRLLEYAKERWGETPYTAWLEWQGMDDELAASAELAKALDKYPDYALFKLEEAMLKIRARELKETELSFETYFGKRKEITAVEYLKLQTTRLHYFLSIDDLTGVEAMSRFNRSHAPTGYQSIEMFFSFLGMCKTSLLRLCLLEWRK